MNPTEEIKTKLGLNTLPEVSNNDWKMYDDGGVEIEVGEFLYGLIRMIKPERILETGLYSGISCSYMALALRDNNKGHIDSIEYEKIHIDRSSERLAKLGVKNLVTIIQEDSRKFNPVNQYDLMFLDTEPNLRFDELVRFYKYLNPGGFVFIHDLPSTFCNGVINPDHPEIKSWPFGEVPKFIIEKVLDDELRTWHFNNPRGMCGFYKVNFGDYRWEK